MAGAPIDFYFDFSSPYGYLGAQRIEALARKHGREVAWRPFLLGVVFKDTGAQPLVDYPIKGEYALRDFKRSARLYGIEFVMPETFPVSALAGSRAFYWLGDRDPGKAKALARALFAAVFQRGHDIGAPERVVEVAADLGVDPEELRAALTDPAVKQRLRDEVGAAIERGVFGSPFFFVDGEPFWGADRLDHVDRWLETGGW
ncbi:MAG: 2-hydroxychromene-2-carboxylate isomerase [Alphaproteobacteria bacterium]